MHEALKNEITAYERQTPKSAEAHKRAQQRVPLGVASNYRSYEPYPIFVKDGKGSRIHDIDGNEYVDHNLCFGVLMAGHGHPAVVGAVERVLGAGTTFGMRLYWFGMVNRGVIRQPFWWDEQWTVSVQHTDRDIDQHLAAFDEVAPGLAKVQQEHRTALVDASQSQGGQS